MADLRIVQITDTHLLASGGVIARNLDLVVEHINATLRPDLVLHSGDVVGIHPDDRDDREAAVRALGALDAPTLYIPGNHDIGMSGPEPWMGLVVTSERVAEHNRVFGEVPFLHPFGEWGLLGLSSELFGTGLPEEDQQWEWLERTLAEPDGGPLLMFMHRPLWLPGPGATVPADTIPVADRDRLLALPGARRLRAIGSGHIHCYRSRPRPERPDLLEVWAPPTGFMGDLSFSEFAQCGVVEWTLHDDHAEARFRAPDGIEERGGGEIPELAAAIEALRR